VESLNGSPITIAPGEVYTALERGVVDGYGWPSIKISDFGWHEVTEYVVEPGFYQVDVGLMVNLKSWNRLPKGLQELLIHIAMDIEREASDYYAQIIKEERSFILSEGVKVIRFSQQDENKFLEEAYQVGWEQVLAKSPETGAKYKELVKKHPSSDQSNSE
jgi:TRAP-type C4-dicarboxylate transport system substrate-binding protein